MSQQEDCFRDVLSRNYARWAGIARCYAGPDSRDDLLQEILLQVWKSLGGFTGRSHIDTWAYRVAINTALAWRRSHQHRLQQLARTPADVRELASRSAGETEEGRAVEEFLTSLSDLDRAVLLLHLDNVPPREVAEILGIQEGTLRVRMHRIRKQFEIDYCGKVNKP